MSEKYVNSADLRNALYDADAVTMRGVAIINGFPAADVVEAVRCRDCKHYDCEDGGQKCVKDADWSVEDGCYYGFISYHGPEFFCADGERKDGEKNE